MDDVGRFLAEMVAGYGKPNAYHWAIEHGGQVIGSISAISVDDRNRSCEVGYCLSHDFWNRGLTGEALKAVLGFLFGQVGMERIMAKCDVQNPASGAVMEKCGMQYEGRLRKHYLRHDGTRSDSLIYAILRDEYAR